MFGTFNAVRLKCILAVNLPEEDDRNNNDDHDLYQNLQLLKLQISDEDRFSRLILRLPSVIG